MNYAAIVATLKRHVTETLKMPDVQEQLRGAGVDAEGSTPAEASAYFLAQREKMTGIVRDLGVTLRQQ